MKKVFYRANNNDVSAAALAVHLCYLQERDVEFIPVACGDTDNRIFGMSDTDVILLGIRIPERQLYGLSSVAKSVTVFYHREEARKELIGAAQITEGLQVSTGTGESTCVVAWRELHPGKQIPGLFLHIQDAELKQNNYGGATKLVNLGLRSRPDWTTWTQFFSRQGLEWLCDDGMAIARYLRVADRIGKEAQEWIAQGIDIVGHFEN